MLSFKTLLFVWDVVVMTSILPTTFLVTYQAAFDASVVWHWAVTYTGDVLYAIWIILNCFRSYTNKRGEEIRDQEMIIIHYALTSFVFDLIAVAPFELFVVMGDASGLNFAVAIMRMNRPLRLYRVWMFLYKEEECLSTNTILLKALRLTFLAAVSMHIVAGVWYSTACSNRSVVKIGGELCLRNSWTKDQSIDWNVASGREKYTVSLYWAVTTLTTVGYGEITPKTDREKWIAVLCMLWGVALFAYILGEVASMLTNANAQRTSYIHRLNVIREQLADANATEALKRKVIGYYEYMWKKNKGESVSEFYDQIPLALQAEVSLESYKGLLGKTLIFQSLPQEFLRMLSMNIKSSLYLPHQVIVNRGDTGIQMYIVQLGEAEVLDDWHLPPLRVLKEGDTFGEGNMFFTIESSEIVRARTHCKVLTISRGDLLSILQHFPKEERDLKHKITKRCPIDLSQRPYEEDENQMVYISLLNQQPSRPVHPVTEQTTLSQKICSYLSHPFMPGSKFLIAWDVIVTCVILMISWIYTYQAAFTHFNPRVGYVGSIQGTVLLVFTYLLDCVLIVDILFSMKRAVRTPTELITKPRAILIRYVCSLWFVLDVLAMLPLEIFGVHWISTAQEWKFIPILRLNRLLKYWKVIVFFKNIEQSLHISIAYLTLLKYAVHIFTAQHIAACLWFFTACYTEHKCVRSSWAEFHGITEYSSAWQDYLVSLYWSTATLTTVGYGDIRAYNTREMVVSMMAQLVGVLMYGYCLGAVAAILTNIAIPRVAFQEKILAVNQFMEEHNMGTGLTKRVNSYLALLWKQYRGAYYPGKKGVFRDMPQTTREEVCLRGYGPLLNKVPFLSGIKQSFLKELSTNTSLYLFAPGDIVLYGGDMGRAMYCIRKGHVEVLSEDLFHVVRVLGPGGHFGDVGFLFGVPRVYTVRAATHCQLLMMRWRDVNKLLGRFPKVKRMFERISSDLDLLAVAEGAEMASNGAAMIRPIKFSNPSVASGLVVAMATPLAVILTTSLTTTVVACVGGKEDQCKITAPISIDSGLRGVLIKHNRTSIWDWLRGNVEHQHKRRTQQRQWSEKDVRKEAMLLDGKGDDEEEYQEEDDPVEDKRYLDLLKQCTKRMQKFFSYCLLPYSIHPNTKVFYLKEMVSMSLVIIMSVVISMQATFLYRNILLWTISYMFDLYFIAEMLVNMHVAYYDKGGVLITHPMLCIAHYLKTSFAIDLISSFPTDLLVVFAWSSNVRSILRLLAVIRINRLLKLYKLPLIFKSLEDHISISMGPIKVAEFFIYMSLGTHLTACIWYVLGCPSYVTLSSYECEVDSWATEYTASIDSPLTHYSFYHQYIVSLYWATATTTTVGYGDIRAHTHLERGYAIFVMLFGVVAYGYLTASVTANLVNADSARAQYQAKLKAINAYLRDYKVDSMLRKRVINYYEYLWKHNKGVNFDNLFEGMPVALQADTSINLYKPIIDKVPLFANTELGFSRLLALSIKPVIFLRKDYIVKKGDIGTEMFFIYRGAVEIVSEDGSVVFALMKEGQFFGEISLFFECPRTASIRAATNCALFVLSKPDLNRVLSYYPHIRQQIREVASRRAELAKKRSLIASEAASKGMSATLAAREAARLTADEDSEEGVVYHPQQLRKKSKTKSEELREQVQSEGYWLTRLKRFILFTIAHNGYFGYFIFWLGCLFSYYSFFTISYQAAFQDYSWGLWLVNYLIEAYFLIEVFLKFHLTYEDDHGNTVSDIKTIVQHYLKSIGGFPLDLVSLFPYELIVLPIRDSRLRVAMVLYMRLPHLTRIVRVKWMFDAQLKYLNQNTVVIQLCKSTVLISLSTHFVACLWYFIACRAGICQENTWASSAGLENPTSPSLTYPFIATKPIHITTAHSHYTSSFYWAVTTMTTVGYGDITATNVPEMVFAIAVMVVGKLLFGFLLGTAASTLTNMEAGRILYEDKLKALMGSLKQQHVSNSTRQRVSRFFEHSWLRNKGTVRQNILSDLPYCLRAQVKLGITETMLRSVKVFRAAELPFLRRLAVLLKPCLFLPGEYIVHKGDLGFGMFFLYQGTVELVDEEAAETNASTDHTAGTHMDTTPQPDISRRKTGGTEYYTAWGSIPSNIVETDLEEKGKGLLNIPTTQPGISRRRTGATEYHTAWGSIPSNIVEPDLEEEETTSPFRGKGRGISKGKSLLNIPTITTQPDVSRRRTGGTEYHTAWGSIPSNIVEPDLEEDEAISPLRGKGRGMSKGKSLLDVSTTQPGISRRRTGATEYHTAWGSIPSNIVEPDLEEDETTSQFRGKGRGMSMGKSPLTPDFAELKSKPLPQEARSKLERYIRKGSAFGLKSLLYSTPAECSARAVDHVDLFCFSSAEFVAVLKDFPRVVADIESTATKEYGKPLKLL